MEAAADSTWKGYSLAERDRRWNAVRRRAAEAGFDCIFVPLTVDPENMRTSSAGQRGLRSDIRYLTQMENGAMVLPTDAAKQPIVVNDRGRGNSWVSNVLPTAEGMRASWGPAMARALRETGMERARIGVSGLKGGKVTHVRAYEGVVNHESFAEVMRQLPNATFEDATDVVGYVRYIKSEEEIECLRRATLIAEAGLDEMIEVARPGVDEAYLYARVTERMLGLGSDHYHWALKTEQLGGEPHRSTEPPIGRRLQPGTLITNEITGIWGGMVAQEDQPIILGPIPEDWKPVIQLQAELYEAGLERMKPGTSFGDFIDFVNGFGATRGMKSLTLLHGRGMGNDGPLLTPRALGEKIRDVPFEQGNTWVWKPYGISADEKVEFVFGGDVVVRANGGEKLFRRQPGLISIP
jgi:Xaa-Pro dipeptidase